MKHTAKYNVADGSIIKFLIGEKIVIEQYEACGEGEALIEIDIAMDTMAGYEPFCEVINGEVNFTKFLIVAKKEPVNPEAPEAEMAYRIHAVLSRPVNDMGGLQGHYVRGPAPADDWKYLITAAGQIVPKPADVLADDEAKRARNEGKKTLAKNVNDAIYSGLAPWPASEAVTFCAPLVGALEWSKLTQEQKADVIADYTAAVASETSPLIFSTNFCAPILAESESLTVEAVDALAAAVGDNSYALGTRRGKIIRERKRIENEINASVNPKNVDKTLKI